MQPVYEPKDNLKDLNISDQIIKYYHHNEIKKFKFTFRKDDKLNESNATLWWVLEKSVEIANTLPNVINFYPVVDETTEEISPVQNALNALHERILKLKRRASTSKTQMKLTKEPSL